MANTVRCMGMVEHSVHNKRKDGTLGGGRCYRKATWQIEFSEYKHVYCSEHALEHAEIIRKNHKSVNVTEL